MVYDSSVMALHFRSAQWASLDEDPSFENQRQQNGDLLGSGVEGDCQAVIDLLVVSRE